MTSKGKKRSAGQGEERTQQPQRPAEEAPERQAESREPSAEHRYRSQRTDLLEGDPAGTAFSEEMGHTPTRE